MSELKCKECGTTLEPNATECSSCGCPVSKAKATQEVKLPKSKKINVPSIVSLFLGIVIVAMGVMVMNKETDIPTYTAQRYNVNNAAFGADFYTEIYNASAVIVGELNDINSGVEVLSETMAVVANIIYYPVGMLIIALGIAIVAGSCNHLRRENS